MPSSVSVEALQVTGLPQALVENRSRTAKIMTARTRPSTNLM
jgi:hypothetical protein